MPGACRRAKRRLGVLRRHIDGKSSDGPAECSSDLAEECSCGPSRSATSASSFPKDDSVSLPFDPEEVQKRYDAERDVRLQARPEGTAQYMPMKELAMKDARFGRMITDPWRADNRSDPRQPVYDDVEVCIVGAGFGALCQGARLVQSGIHGSGIRLVDTAADVGGTWYWNRYPGAMCDVESYTYMPLCEELGYEPTEKYAHQPELLRHSQAIAEKFGLFEKALFGTKCTGMKWDEDSGMWTVSTDQGDSFRARYVFINFGTLTEPKLPRVSGLTEFRGHMFHTSRWDYKYTGGDTTGGLHKLRDKRVAIIGTGATSVQVVPHLGAHSKQLFVFQRTPSSVDVRDNRKTTPEFAENFLSKPGWQKERQKNFTIMCQTNQLGVKDLINDGWTKIMRNLNQEFQSQRVALRKRARGSDREDVSKKIAVITQLRDIADMRQMHEIRKRVESTVHDKNVAEDLKPWYQQFCKRPCFHDEYLETFNLPSVKLVHDPLGMDHITDNGIIVGGKEYQVDCIVFATGFEIGSDVLDTGYKIIGRGGVELKRKWADGPRTFMSFTTHGFPNMFMQNAPQGTFTTNYVQKLDEEAIHTSYMIRRARAKKLKAFDPLESSEVDWCNMIFQRSKRGQKFFRKCTPGYYNKEGKVTTGRHLNANYGGPLKWFAMLEKRREEGTEFEGYHLTFRK